MNRLERKFLSRLKSCQKKEILRKIILENKNQNSLEKMDLINKLNSATDKDIDLYFDKVIKDLEG